MLVQPHSATPQVAGAIQQAATSTGASFGYLLATAQIESNFNPQAQAATSSAQGLFQFIEQTWLATMKEAGAKLGFGDFAANISRTPDGRYEVANPHARNAIMSLRHNARVSAMMAGAYAQTNAAQLTNGLGRAPTEGELYIAHFLGADGAARLIGAALHQPNASAASLFPQAAAANRSIFYNRLGFPRSTLDVYRVLTNKYETARAAPAVAGISDSVPADGTGSPARNVATALSRIPDTAGVARAYEAGRQMAYAAAPPPRVEPFFQSMFSTGPSRGVSPVVRGLWTTPSATDPGTRPVNLFTDIEPAPSKNAKSGI
jgi:hypothetical protein